MKQYKTEAIILDTTDVFDADRSFLLFSRDLGKIRARAKGVRKPTSKLTGHLLTFIPTQLELVEQGDFFLIVQAQVANQYAEQGTYPENSLLFINQATILAEALNRLFTEREAHPEVYEGLAYTLDRLRNLCGAGDATQARIVVVEFLVKALATLGYRPQLHRCVVTDQPIQEDFVGWNSMLGGVVTEEGYNQTGRQGRILQYPRTLVVLRQLLQPEFVAERLRVSPELEQEAAQITYDYLQTQIGQPLRSIIGGQNA